MTRLISRQIHDADRAFRHRRMVLSVLGDVLDLDFTDRSVAVPEIGLANADDLPGGGNAVFHHAERRTDMFEIAPDIDRDEFEKTHGLRIGANKIKPITVKIFLAFDMGIPTYKKIASALLLNRKEPLVIKAPSCVNVMGSLLSLKLVLLIESGLWETSNIVCLTLSPVKARLAPIAVHL